MTHLTEGVVSAHAENDAPLPWQYRYTEGTRDDAITIPNLPRDTQTGPEDVIVSRHVANRVVRAGTEVALAYFTLATWEARREEVSELRYVREVYPHATWPLDALRKMGLIRAAAETWDRARAEEVLMERVIREIGSAHYAQRKARRRKLVIPDPFPTFTGRAWSGTRDDLHETSPRPRTPVVYDLYDADGGLLYVGSTDDVWNRFSGHTAKPWARFIARECADREAAYWLEAVEIIERKPPLDRGDSVGGRVQLLTAADFLVTRGGAA